MSINIILYGEWELKDIEDIKYLIIFVLIADVIGTFIYLSKGNTVGVFNCISWCVIATFVLMNYNKVLK